MRVADRASTRMQVRATGCWQQGQGNREEECLYGVWFVWVYECSANLSFPYSFTEAQVAI